jgi:hypothetical protein
VKCIGPASNSPDSSFDADGVQVTVAQYYANMCTQRKQAYVNCLSKGKLRYPSLPTINVGTNQRPVLVPPELVIVPSGQCRSNVCTKDMTASMIRFVTEINTISF